MYGIRQQGEQWELLRDGDVVSSHATYDLALGELADMLAVEVVPIDDTAEDAPPADAGLLPEVWNADLCFSEPTGDGRDFSNCAWTSRDPSTSTLPLMLQTCNDMGHFGAELAGFFTSITLGAAPTAEGRFYDSDAGEQLRDMLLGGRRFGVSVDPGACSAEYICTAMDDDGWCEEGVIDFLAYEIIGCTATPFPGFAEAAVYLATIEPATAAAPEGEQPAPAPAVAASGRVLSHSSSVALLERTRANLLTRPPRSYFDDPAFEMPTPLTITNDGHVMAHVAAWGTCHVGSERICVVPPNSRLNYERFYAPVDPNVRPSAGIVCDDGSTIRTGALTWGIPHAGLTLDMIRAQAHYADSRYGWADVIAGEDEFGIWVAGALRPNVTDEEVRILQALALSGDWRHDSPAWGGTGELEMIAGLAVNVPGFPIPTAVVASGMKIEQPRVAAALGASMTQSALVASGIVLPQHFAALTRSPCSCDDSDGQLDRIERKLSLLDLRTRHLVEPAVDHLAGRFESNTVRVPDPPATYHPHRQ